jgi:hypothetical protein
VAVCGATPTKELASTNALECHPPNLTGEANCYASDDVTACTWPPAAVHDVKWQVLYAFRSLQGAQKLCWNTLGPAIFKDSDNGMRRSARDSKLQCNGKTLRTQLF